MSAFLKLRGGARPGRSCSSRPSRAARRALLVHRLPPAQGRCAGRSAIGGDPYALAAAELGRVQRRRRCADLPPFAGGAVGFFAYDLVRTVEPLGEPNPDALGAARPGADAHRRAGRLRPPQAHGDGARQRLRRATISRPPTPGGRRRSREVRWRLAGPVPRPARPPDRRSRRSRVHRRTCRASSSRRWSRRIIEYIYAGDAYPGRALAALVGARAGRGVLDLPRPARRQPEPVHVLPGLRRLRDRRRQPRAADHGQRARRSRRARSPAPARAARPPRRTGASPRSCSPTRRSAPST